MDSSCKREHGQTVTALLLLPLKVRDSTAAGPANVPRPGTPTRAEAAVRGYLEASTTHSPALQPCHPHPRAVAELREYRHVPAHAPEPPA